MPKEMVTVNSEKYERLLTIESSALIQVILWERQDTGAALSTKKDKAAPPEYSTTRKMEVRAKRRLIAAVRNLELDDDD